MSAGLVVDLWADLLGEPATRRPAPTPANSANSANREQPRGVTADPTPCEGVRFSANPGLPVEVAAVDSQKFAALRKVGNEAESEQPCGSSQDSQNSQGLLEPTRFLDRRARLIRWGWPEVDADALAERLAKRDRGSDKRVSCADCRHCRAGRCGNYRRAGVGGPELGRDLIGMLQHCPGFEETATPR